MLALGGILLSKGNLNQVFGAPPTPIGQPLYSGFTAADITQISLKSNGTSATFSRESGVWMMTEPVKDRMDPRWAKTLIDFTLATRAADVIPNEKIDTIQAGLQEGTVQVRLSDKEGKSRAKYVIGRRTAWMEQDPESGEDIPTVFLQPRDRSRKSHVYACTGDIRPIFKDGLRYFRDHQPFLFAPSQLQKIHIKSASSEFVVETVGPQRVWRITKPQKLATETVAIKNLIEKGLFSLRALRVFDRSQVTLPSVEESNYIKIAIQSAGQTEPVTLEVYPPADAQATTVYATVTDRPNTVFELPLRPVPDLISLSELPLSNYNELRSQSLTSLDPKKLSAIHFAPSKSPEILLSRPPRGSWRYHIDDKNTSYLNELTLYQFLKTMTETKVAGFITDSAFLTEDSKDWDTYGLRTPLLTIRFLFRDDSVLILKIGKTKDGVTTAHLNHPDTLHTVVKLADDFLDQMPIRHKQWKDTRLLAIATMDFTGLERKLMQQPPLNLRYNDKNETWQASRNGEDASGQLNTARAKKLLEALGDLRVTAWLDADNQEAMDALVTPALTLAITSHRLNEFGEQDGLINHLLEITPVTPGAGSQYYYGRLSGQQDLFLIDRNTALRLALDLFTESE